MGRVGGTYREEGSKCCVTPECTLGLHEETGYFILANLELL